MQCQRKPRAGVRPAGTRGDPAIWGDNRVGRSGGGRKLGWRGIGRRILRGSGRRIPARGRARVRGGPGLGVGLGLGERGEPGAEGLEVAAGEAGDGEDLGVGGDLQGVDGAEVREEGFLGFLADAGDVVELGLEAAALAGLLAAAVREAVRLVARQREEEQLGAVRPERDRVLLTRAGTRDRRAFRRARSRAPSRARRSRDRAGRGRARRRARRRAARARRRPRRDRAAPSRGRRSSAWLRRALRRRLPCARPAPRRKRRSSTSRIAA